MTPCLICGLDPRPRRKPASTGRKLARPIAGSRPAPGLRAGRGAAAAVLLLALAIALVGCGKKGPPEPPPGSHQVYPRIYPKT